MNNKLAVYMQKLTKEQADWLTEQFNIAHAALMKKPAEGMFHILDCRSLINQCTEKEFPGFCMNVYESNEIEKGEVPDIIEIKQYGDYTAAISIMYQDRSAINRPFEFLIPTDKFQQFTDKCQVICEWLEEQK